MFFVIGICFGVLLSRSLDEWVSGFVFYWVAFSGSSLCIGMIVMFIVAKYNRAMFKYNK